MHFTNTKNPSYKNQFFQTKPKQTKRFFMCSLMFYHKLFLYVKTNNFINFLFLVFLNKYQCIFYFDIPNNKEYLCIFLCVI